MTHPLAPLGRVRSLAALALAAATLTAAVGGCTQIDPGPSPAVRHATSLVSPALVRIDVVTEEFSGGLPQAQRSLGSGVIIDKEGRVLTNFHVAGRAKRIDVTLANQEHVRAHLLGSDHWTDLALVQLDMKEIKARGLTFEFAPLGDSSKIALGQPVMALGTPYGLSRTLTAGIVSNTDRFFDESTIGGYETGWFNNWIQTDAAINPGNSGGPLIDLRGQVVGINTRGASSGNNLGFAIPINVAKRVIAEILDHKEVRRSYVGVQLQPLQDLEKFYDLGADKGVLIRSVEPNSPASEAGIQPEDILLAVNDIPVVVRFPEQLAGVRKLIADQPIGSAVKLTVRRDNKSLQTFTVSTEKLESVITEEEAISVWGLSARNLTRAYLRDRHLPFVKGVLITGVREGSSAQTAGIRSDDIILKVAGQAVTTTGELDAAAKAAEKAGKPVAVDIRRDRAEKTLVLKPKQ